ncbi:hypothetical protein M885DRAFT_546063, partial [Pelagophyceae sp. CCMP2097]
LVECLKCPRAFCDACCTVDQAGCLVCDDCAVKTHVSYCLKCSSGGQLVECSKCPRAFCDACCTVGATGCLVCDDCAVKTHVSYCYKCDDEAHIQCSNCPRSCCGECSAEGARGGFVCDECGFKECLQGSLGPLFEKLNIEAQTAGSPGDFMRLIRLATAALDAQMSELAELERIVSHGRGFTAKKQQGLALLRLLQNGGEPGDAGGPLLSAVQISRLKKELVEHIFAWGHGNVAQTKLLLEAVFNDELVRFVVPRFAADDGGGLSAQEIVKGIRDFVATRKLPSVGGTYVTEKYIDLETIALATAASGGGPDVGVPASFLRRHEELLADVRRGPRQRRKDKLKTAIIAEFWHDSRVSRIDTFSQGPQLDARLLAPLHGAREQQRGLQFIPQKPRASRGARAPKGARAQALRQGLLVQHVHQVQVRMHHAAAVAVVRLPEVPADGVLLPRRVRLLRAACQGAGPEVLEPHALWEGALARSDPRLRLRRPASV